MSGLSGNTKRDIVTSRFLFNVLKRNKYQDTLRDAVIGDFKWSARLSNFSGWLICDGSAVSRTTYADLFNIIGTTFGAGNGTTTFNLPDMRGRVPGGIGTGSGLSARSMGTAVGAETHTLSVSEMPTHSHSVIDGGHSHGEVPGDTQTIAAASGGALTAADEVRNGSTDSAFTGITIGNTGDGGAHNNMQPTLFLGNVFIYSGIEEPLEYIGDLDGPSDTNYN